MEEILKTSAEWYENLEGIELINPDGWDRTNFVFSFHEKKITFKEFSKRMLRSTTISKIIIFF